MTKRLKSLTICSLAVASWIGLLTANAPTFAQSLEEKIDKSLESTPPTKQKPLTRGIGGGSVNDRKASEERRFIDTLRTRSISIVPTQEVTVEQREKIAKFVEEKPKIDLEIYFDYDSATIGPKAVPSLVALGNVLSKEKFKDTVFLINGYTDAKGSPEYNLALSQRRAEAVKQVLVDQYKMPAATLVVTGFGKEQLKVPNKPFADENRRVQIVNTEQKAGPK